MNTYNYNISNFYLFIFYFIMPHIYFIVASMIMKYGGHDQI